MRLSRDRAFTIQAAFTLVELLVVIGILAVLIGILLPSLSKARAAGMRTKCLSNLRSMQLAQWVYVTENRGYLIQGGMAHGGVHDHEEISWFNTLNAISGGKLVARCPADDSPHWDVPLNGHLRSVSYGINGFLDRELCPWGPAFSPTPAGGLYIKIEHVRRVAEVTQFVEMARQGEYAASDHVHPNLFAAATTPEAAIPDRVAKEIQIHAHGGKIDFQATANYGFLDGHAETLRLRDVYPSLYVNKFDPASPQPKP